LGLDKKLPFRIY
jgi:hypothetical protein